MSYYLNLALSDIKNEKWEDIAGYDDIYNVSTFGRIKSLGRYVNSSHGNQRWIKEKILKQYIDRRYKEPQVKLSINAIGKTHRVAALVGDAFLRNKHNNEEYCHLDKNKLNNVVTNLIVTSCSNSQKISYINGNMVNWGIEKLPKKVKEKYEKENGIYKNGKLIKKRCTICNFSLSYLCVDLVYIL